MTDENKGVAGRDHANAIEVAFRNLSDSLPELARRVPRRSMTIPTSGADEHDDAGDPQESADRQGPNAYRDSDLAQFVGPVVWGKGSHEVPETPCSTNAPDDSQRCTNGNRRTSGHPISPGPDGTRLFDEPAAVVDRRATPPTWARLGRARQCTAFCTCISPVTRYPRNGNR